MIKHEGFRDFSAGTFDNAGANLFVDAHGVIRRIMDNDLNNDGIFDLVLPNSHGYVERAPTEIHKLVDGQWQMSRLPQDSGWMPRVADVDGDGYPDLIVANGENGVTSELQSCIHWGGPGGLSGDCSYFDTVGAYDVAVCDLTGNGLQDLIFTTAWYDHHNPGKTLPQKVFLQNTPRVFSDATDRCRIPGIATVSLLCEDVTGNGYPDLVLGNRRKGFDSATDSFLFFGSEDGFDPENMIGLPIVGCTQVMAADLRGDGFKDLVFTGSNRLIVYHNNKGQFDRECREVIEVSGSFNQFLRGMLATEIADVDGDGVPEVLIGTRKGIEIRKPDRLREVHSMIECYACSCLRAADINGSGAPDLIASHYCSEKTYDAESLVFWNTGSGYNTRHTTAFPTHGPMGCTAADFDQDGIMEIVFCNTMSGPSQYDPEFPVFVYFGDPDLEYSEQNRRDYPITYMSHSFINADVDNDGFVELVLTSAHGLRLFKGTADGPDPAQFVDIIHPLGDEVLVGGVLVADLNRNGWLDLIMVPWVKADDERVMNNAVAIYFGGPQGYSQSRRQILPANVDSSQSVLLADINNDGWLDFLYGSREGHIGVYYGSEQGFTPEQVDKIFLKDHNGSRIFRLNAVDIDGDGQLEIFLTTAGHYTRQASHLYILNGALEGFPQEKTFKFDTGGSTGIPSLADINGDGHLDLLLPFYSTTASRELPARIFKGDGTGGFDWEHPINVDCMSSIAFMAVDLDGNGFNDLFICCHRNDLGHMVKSKLIRNGPDGLDIENAEEILGYGPHNFTVNDQANISDRSTTEYYTSPVFPRPHPIRLSWEGETPHRTVLEFHVRFGSTPDAARTAEWNGPSQERVIPLNPPAGSRFMQYRVAFHAPGLVNSPSLHSVTIDSHSPADAFR